MEEWDAILTICNPWDVIIPGDDVGGAFGSDVLHGAAKIEVCEGD